MSLIATFAVSLPFFKGSAQNPKPQKPPAAATPTATPPQEPEDYSDDDVVRITTNLVQVDLVVTDGKGNQVTNLTQDDFEIYEEGKQQPITNFSWVSNEQTPALTTSNPSVTTSPATGLRVRAETPRHTIAIVIDDRDRGAHGSHLRHDVIQLGIECRGLMDKIDSRLFRNFLQAESVASYSSLGADLGAVLSAPRSNALHGERNDEQANEEHADNNPRNPDAGHWVESVRNGTLRKLFLNTSGVT